jgi:hypothetical protein
MADSLMTIAVSTPWVRFIATDIFVWEGLTILLSYEPDWMGLGGRGVGTPLAHLELQVVAPRGAPIPLSDTGYWSEFFEPNEDDDGDTPRALALALLQEFSDAQTWRVARARWELSEGP